MNDDKHGPTCAGVGLNSLAFCLRKIWSRNSSNLNCTRNVYIISCYQWVIIISSGPPSSGLFLAFEPREFAIPEDGVLCFDGQPVDGSFGDCELGSSWHRIGSPFASRCSKAFVHAVMEGMTARTLRGRGPAECGVAIVFLIIVTL